MARIHVDDVAIPDVTRELELLLRIDDGVPERTHPSAGHR